MMARLFRLLVALAILGGVVFWFVTAPKSLPDDALAGLSGDAERGKIVFYAGGCASCHAAPNASGDEKLILAGGRSFPSPFGTFIAPNISPSSSGIGDWTAMDLANAMIHGVSPEGAHYFPAFPYTSYNKANLQDIVDLKAFIDQLPADETANQPHQVGFPFNIRRSLGGWKLLFATDAWTMQTSGDPVLERGRYLVEALGHCAECHTPRGSLGGLDRSAWMTGAPSPEGDGRVPNITPAELFWSVEDIAYYLETGFTPEFDNAGGHMADVVENTANLSADDRMAIAVYLQNLTTP